MNKCNEGECIDFTMRLPSQLVFPTETTTTQIQPSSPCYLFHRGVCVCYGWVHALWTSVDNNTTPIITTAPHKGQYKHLWKWEFLWPPPYFWFLVFDFCYPITLSHTDLRLPSEGKKISTYFLFTLGMSSIL